jgi:hypothetical protein
MTVDQIRLSQWCFAAPRSACSALQQSSYSAVQSCVKIQQPLYAWDPKSQTPPAHWHLPCCSVCPWGTWASLSCSVCPTLLCSRSQRLVACWGSSQQTRTHTLRPPQTPRPRTAQAQCRLHSTSRQTTRHPRKTCLQHPQRRLCSQTPQAGAPQSESESSPQGRFYLTSGCC